MTAEPQIGVAACAGRMGRAIAGAVIDTAECRLGGASQYAGHPAIGRDAGVLAGRPEAGLPISGDASAMIGQVDAVIDFSTPDATRTHLAAALAHATPIVIGTTGMAPADHRALETAARDIAIVAAPNMSVGGTLLAALTEHAAAILDEDYDIEVLGFQHRHKVDAPSGTAFSVARAAARGRGVPPDTVGATPRDGHTGPRPPGLIGMTTIQGGTVSGEHSAIFAGPGERLEIHHKPTDRRVYALGAVRSALWLICRPPGLYDMRDVLGLALRGKTNT
ncbi:MAG: 4-hydroxy-tetrahydrodipicolinate reductase [Alphaproteobacteria bacterium]|nr:4-hydroxy-tetrahydrodipicolinate reductase [Alphaproteobacteria bacterium]